eukprot:6190174-Pleurochrysis_carterae.AAC.2
MLQQEACRLSPPPRRLHAPPWTPHDYEIATRGQFFALTSTQKASQSRGTHGLSCPSPIFSEARHPPHLKASFRSACSQKCFSLLHEGAPKAATRQKI